MRIFNSMRTDIRVAVVNAYGPGLVQPRVMSLMREPKVDVFYLRLPPLAHTAPNAGSGCELDLDCRGSFTYCASVIAEIKPDVLYVQDNGLYNIQIAPHAKIAFPHIPFVYEPYDMVASIYSDPTLMAQDGRTLEDVAFCVELERFMLETSDGVVHKDVGPSVNAILLETEANHLEFNAYPDEKDFRFREIQTSPSQPILCWAGGIAPDSACDETRGENKLYNFFRSLLEQGMSVIAYNALARDRGHLEAEYGNYLALAKHNASFTISPFTPRENLIEDISSRAHWGMHLYPKPKSDAGRAAMYGSSMAAKVLTYLAAGIPIVTVEFLEPIARFVREYDVGIVIGESDFDNLGSILREADYMKIKARVKSAQSQISVQANLRRLERFFSDVLNNR